MASSFNHDPAANYLHSGVTSSINAAAIAVHRALGPGFLEAIYEAALCVELDKQSIAYHRQLPVRVRYNNVPVGLYRLDLVVENKVVVEVKAVSAIDLAHMATVFAYLKATELQVGLIVNFASEVVRIKRVFRSTHGVNENPTEPLKT